MSFKQFVRDSIPRPVLPFARSAYHAGFRITLRPRCKLVELRETLDPFLKTRLQQVTPRTLPPPLMRYRVGEDLDPFMFVSLGTRIVEDLERCVALQGETLGSFSSILDFGCGCGRTLLQLIDKFPGQHLSGTDIDADAVAWCQQNLKPAQFRTNGPEPPVNFQAGAFDLVYVISVFTHLDRRRQEQWLPEFHRLLRPEGVLVVTVHGETAAIRAGIDWADLPDVKEKGVAFLECAKNADIHPDWYQTSFNDRAYTERAFGQYFANLAYVEGVFGFQDAMVCRKPAR